MPEKTKQAEAERKVAEKSAAEKREADEKGNWSEDQREKNYYYDDAYGYEIYNPNENDEPEPDVSESEK